MIFSVLDEFKSTEQLNVVSENQSAGGNAVSENQSAGGNTVSENQSNQQVGMQLVRISQVSRVECS